MTATAITWRLRVLSGAHAGAETGLSPGVIRVATDDAADICLTDWVGDSAEIDVTESGALCLRASGVDDSGVGDQAIELGMPFMRGGVVLVIGPTADWPADEVLWRRWLGRDNPPESAPSTRASPAPAAVAGAPMLRPTPMIGRWLIYAATAAATLLLAFAVVLSRQATARSPGSELQWAGLRARIEAMPDAQLSAELTGPGGVRVSGWLRSTQDRQRLAKLLSVHGATKVTQSFLVTQEVAQSLAQSAGEAIHVKAIEIDRFEVTGRVRHIEQVRKRLHQAMLDIGLQHSRLQDSLLEDLGAPDAISDAAFADSELRYRQLRDGSRLLQIGSSIETHQP